MRIRPVKLTDADAILEIYSPYIHNTTVTFETTVPTRQQFTDRIIACIERYPWLVAENMEGTVVGYAYATRHRDREAYQWCVESSVYVLEAYHGRGVAARLYEALLKILEQCGYVNVYAGITMPNAKSLSFHVKMGFKEVGIYHGIGYKLGSWHDVAWLVKTINPHGGHPNTPLHWSAGSFE